MLRKLRVNIVPDPERFPLRLPERPLPAASRREPDGVNAGIGEVPCSTLHLKSLVRRAPSLRRLRWLLGS
jgi:hypothetical protein